MKIYKIELIMLLRGLNNLINKIRGRNNPPSIIKSVPPLNKFYGYHTDKFLKLKRNKQLKKR